MRRLWCTYCADGTFGYQQTGEDATEGFGISFVNCWRLKRRKSFTFLDGVLEANGIDWIWTRGNDWYINFDGINAKDDILKDVEWLRGTARVEPHMNEPRGFNGDEMFPSLDFDVYRDEFVTDRKRKLFLSHNGTDKPMVRSYFDALAALGFEPWLDEQAMVAGTELERALLKGFDESCGAVFFATPQFSDADFIATEINYAIAEKRKKGERFSIVTLVFNDGANKGTVPELLKQYVWKEPANHLEGLVEIIRAIPIKLGAPTWRDHIPAS